MTQRYIKIGGFGTFPYDDAEYAHAIETDGDITGITPLNILTSLLTVDGSGSKLDSDLLDGEHGSYYAVASPKVMFTPEGGLAVRLTNSIGRSSVKGEIVTVDTNGNEAVKLEPAGGKSAIGAIYEGGIAEGGLVWVVISGVAEVLLVDATGSLAGNWVITGSVAGRANATATTPPGSLLSDHEIHFAEIGHSIETVVAGTDKLCKIIMHFN